MIRVSMFPVRVYVFRHRLHHGVPGLALAAFASSLPVRVFGLALVLHDAADRAVWVRDLLAHP
jgi:uncharacterized membrane protein